MMLSGGRQQCPACGESKPATVEFFHRANTQKSGIQARCRLCCNATASQYRPCNDPHYQRIAKAMGITPREVRKLERSAFKKLRRSKLAREIAG